MQLHALVGALVSRTRFRTGVSSSFPHVSLNGFRRNRWNRGCRKSIRELLGAFLLACFLAPASSCFADGAQSSGTFGELNVTGDVQITGSTFAFGTALLSGSNVSSGVALTYSDSQQGTNAALTWTAFQQNQEWIWESLIGATAAPIMKIDAGNALKLYPVNSGSGTPSIVLDPSLSGTSSIAGSISVTGSVNQMPNQTLTGGSSSILTLGLADQRYLQAAAASVAIGYGAIAGSQAIVIGQAAAGTGRSIAIGNQSNASSDLSTAIGYSSVAPGYAATALGYSATAANTWALALGNEAAALGYWSVAIGPQAKAVDGIAIGQNALSNDAGLAIGLGSFSAGGRANAIGFSATASAYMSTALGCNTNATGQYSMCLSTAGTASGESSFAAGAGCVAAGGCSTVSGWNSVATSDHSVSMGVLDLTEGWGAVALGGYSTGHGDLSVALGYRSYTNGAESFAAGNCICAWGASSTVTGAYNNALGDYSQACGYATTAETCAQTVVGLFNKLEYPHYFQDTVQERSYPPQPNTALFTVGNGTKDTNGNIYGSNAFVVRMNGDSTVYGKLTVSGTSNGGIVVSGTMDPTTNVVVASSTNALVLIPQQGDLSMGDFHAGPQPPTAP